MFIYSSGFFETSHPGTCEHKDELQLEPNSSIKEKEKQNMANSTNNSSEKSKRGIYPDVPFSPYSSPKAVRHRPPLKESRRVSIDKTGQYLQLNQYRLIDSIGQVKQNYL